MGCHSSLSDDLSVHARIDSTSHVRLLWESSEEDNKCTHAPIFEKKFGKKVEDATKNSRERTARTLFTDLRSVALDLECSDLNITEDNFVPTEKSIQDAKERQLMTRSGLQRLRCFLYQFLTGFKHSKGTKESILSCSLSLPSAAEFSASRHLTLAWTKRTLNDFLAPVFFFCLNCCPW